MSFHFTGFSYSSDFHVFKNFGIDFPGGGEPFPLDIIVYTQPTDRYSEVRGVYPSATICIVGPQLSILPIDYDGFYIERSDDGGQTWSDISGLIRESFFYVDTPPGNAVYFYRAVMKLTSGSISSPGNEVQVTVGSWGDADDLGITEILSSDGDNAVRISQNSVFPLGTDGDSCDGVSISEGSMAGGSGSGVWYIRTREYDEPIVYDNNPVCNSIGVVLPITQISLKIQDKPYPVGGSGIDDSFTVIMLSVSSRYNGASIIVRQGLVQPASPLINCVISPGLDPNLDRDVLISFAADYISQGDVVEVVTIVRDIDGNETISSCTFEMEEKDDEAPEVVEEDPECGLGIESDDTRRASRNTDFSFSITDNDSGVVQASIDVFYGSSTIGPWTLVLNNGSIFLGGFSGTVTSNGSSGYDIVIKRPTSSPLWTEGSTVCFRILVDDNEGNSAEEICCFKVEDKARLGRVIPISEDILFVEFSIEMLNGMNIRDPRNYIITTLETDIDPVMVKKVVPHLFSAAVDELTPGTEFGEGAPFFVYLNTSISTSWGKYQLEVNGNNVVDKYGIAMDSSGTVGYFRGRRTKVDEGRDSIGGFMAREDSLLRKILTSIFHSDEQIGGVYFDNDWE